MALKKYIRILNESEIGELVLLIEKKIEDYRNNREKILEIIEISLYDLWLSDLTRLKENIKFGCINEI